MGLSTINHHFWDTPHLWKAPHGLSLCEVTESRDFVQEAQANAERRKIQMESEALGSLGKRLNMFLFLPKKLL